MFIQADLVREEKLQAYNLQSIIHNNKTCMRIDKGMHGLKEAGTLAYDELRQHLEQCRCHPTRHTPGLWKHVTNKILFTLMVDDFGIKHLTTKKCYQHNQRFAR